MASAVSNQKHFLLHRLVYAPIGMVSTCMYQYHISPRLLGWMYASSFSYRSVSAWNSLPESVVMTPTVALFKIALEIVIRDDLHHFAYWGY